MNANTCVVYVRVSTEEQTKGTSPESQRELCEQYASRMGMRVVDVCYDLGVSGTMYRRRPGIQKAIGYIERGEASALVAFKLDRIGRNTKIILEIADRCDQAGGRMLTCDGFELGGTPVGKMILTMLAAVAELEHGLIRERCMTGKRTLAEKGIQPARGRMPYAYRIVTRQDVTAGRFPAGSEGTYQIDEERAGWVRQMYDLYVNGRSLRQISQWLHDNGVPTAQGANYWHPNTIRDLLGNPVNKGTAVWGHHEHRSDESRLAKGYKTDRYRRVASKDQQVTIDAPAIVSEQLWEAVQARIATNRQTQSGNPDRKYMLTGILRCKDCDTLMIAKRRRQFAYYYCRYYSAAQHPSGKVCDRRSYQLRVIEEQLTRGLLTVVNEPALVKDAIAAYRNRQRPNDTQSKVDGLRKSLKALENEESAIVTAQIDGISRGVNPAIYGKKLEEVAQKRAAAEKTLNGLLASVKEARADVSDLDAVKSTIGAVEVALKSEWITTAEKNELIKRVVDTAWPEGDDLHVQFKPVNDETVGLMVISLTVSASDVKVRVTNPAIELAAA